MHVPLSFPHTLIKLAPLEQWLQWPTCSSLAWNFWISHPRNHPRPSPGKTGMAGPPAWLHHGVIWEPWKKAWCSRYTLYRLYQKRWVWDPGDSNGPPSVRARSWELTLTFCAAARASEGNVTHLFTFHILFVINSACILTRLHWSETFP